MHMEPKTGRKGQEKKGGHTHKGGKGPGEGGRQRETVEEMVVGETSAKV